MISLATLIPLFGCSHILLSKGDSAKKLSLAYSLITIVFSLLLLLQFDMGSINIQFVTNIFTSSLYTIDLGLDALSLIFILLTTFTVPLCILASWSNLGTNYKNFNLLMLIFEAFTNLVWLAQDLFLFYIAFEAVLVPLFLIIGMFSKGSGKTRAAFLLFLYTFTGSLFILLGFSALYYYTGTSSITILTSIDLNSNLQTYVWLAIFLSFAVKNPLVPFHNWILRAHVEASVAGSIILAGLTLKMATYGILRILLPILPEASILFAPFANSLAVISIVYGSLAAIRQSDFKCLLAYSSVAHMGVIVLGIFSNSFVGITGALLLSLAHGFVSPALFFILGGVIYDRFHTRTIKLLRGLSIYMPITIIFFFLFTLSNIAVPGSVNWIGEFIALIGAYYANPIVGALGATSVFLGACYSIWLYNRVAFGTYSPYLSFTSDITRREFIILFSFLVPTVLLGLYPKPLINLLYVISSIIYNS